MIIRNLFRCTLSVLLLTTLNPQLSKTFAQGSLAPPGAPAPTMKSFDQIEPRTPISSAPFSITNTGSYYLTTNLNVSTGNAITIATNGVTLDLNGFTISSTQNPAPTGTGILFNGGLRNITIANGFIQGGVTNNGSGIYSGNGFGSGIVISGTSPVNVLVSRVSVSGCLQYGIALNANSTIVEFCTIRTVGNYGIGAATVKGCVAFDCGNAGIDGYQVSDCQGASSGSGQGVIAFTVQNCSGQSSSGYGVFSYHTANGCYGASSTGIGLFATTAQNCYGQSDSGIALSATTAINCYGSSASNQGIAAFTATSCFGASGGDNRGISANIAMGCYGESAGGSFGIHADYLAFLCQGVSSTGTGLYAYIANSCVGSSVSYTYHYNMPP